MNEAPRREPRPRGVRLSDLDRSLVYRIAYSGRRWEVLGPEGPAPAGAGPDEDGGADASGGAARTAVPPSPRHAAAADPPD